MTRRPAVDMVDLPAMSSSGEKGSFSADIAQDVIDEALKSVERRERADVAQSGGPEQADVSQVPAPIPGAEIDTLKAELELSTARGREMMQKLKDEHERVLRAAADLENYKKRAAKEKEEVQRYGIERLLKDFLPVYDNFGRALEHARGPADFESLKQGVEMIRRLFEDTLGKHGVKTFSAQGEPFDPNRHEAMKVELTSAVPPNHVVAEVLKGFTLNDRLVRPALVVVSRAEEPPAESKGDSGGPASGDDGATPNPTS
jgi:molecular chaperone GrpE